MARKNLSELKYKNVGVVVSRGYRRVTKTELKRLGYSRNSVLYTAKGGNASKVFTRYDLAQIQKPVKAEALKNRRFREIKKERIRVLKAKRVKRTFTIYSSNTTFLYAKQVIPLLQAWFTEIERTYNPRMAYIEGRYSATIGLVFFGFDDGGEFSFSIMPRFWNEREDMISEFAEYGKRYKKGNKYLHVYGWLETAK